jgi:ketosteroid isomerase-like protein
MSAEIEQILARLDRLESREAIRELATTYAIACDEHDMPRLTALFTEDACFDAPNGAMVANGKAEIVSMFERTFKIRGPAYHWTHDVTIAFDEGDPNRATGLVLSHAETSPGGVVSIAAMRYEDEYRREEGVWRFAKRVIYFLYYVPAIDYANGLNQAHRVVMGEQRMAADYPEALPAWQAFIEQHGPLEI